MYRIFYILYVAYCMYPKWIMVLSLSATDKISVLNRIESLRGNYTGFISPNVG